MTEAPQPDDGSAPTDLEVLRRIRESETAWEKRLADARRAGEAQIAQAKHNAEAALEAARADLERKRQELLEGARRSVEAEAVDVIAKGQSAAQAIETGGEAVLSKSKGAILDALFGRFRSRTR